jgi:hypothetical protein
MTPATDWRKKAIEYWEKAKTVNDDGLREQYAELAARYLDLAERQDDELIEPPHRPSEELMP